MSLFTKQPMRCCICAVGFVADPEKPICSIECHEEWEWRKTLFIRGKPYYEHPRKAALRNDLFPNGGL